MSFSSMLEILELKEKDKIIFMRAGAFYIATGKNAVLLSKVLGLKCTCYKNNICKVGFPINSLENYINKLEETKYAYIIYDYDKVKNELIIKYKKEGRKNEVIEKNNNCLLCKGISKYSEDNYMLALSKLFEKENERYEHKQ